MKIFEMLDDKALETVVGGVGSGESGEGSSPICEALNALFPDLMQFFRTVKDPQAYNTLVPNLRTLCSYNNADGAVYVAKGIATRLRSITDTTVADQAAELAAKIEGIIGA